MQAVKGGNAELPIPVYSALTEHLMHAQIAHAHVSRHVGPAALFGRQKLSTGRSELGHTRRWAAQTHKAGMLPGCKIQLMSVQILDVAAEAVHRETCELPSNLYPPHDLC